MLEGMLPDIVIRPSNNEQVNIQFDGRPDQIENISVLHDVDSKTLTVTPKAKEHSLKPFTIPVRETGVFPIYGSMRLQVNTFIDGILQENSSLEPLYDQSNMNQYKGIEEVYGSITGYLCPEQDYEREVKANVLPSKVLLSVPKNTDVTAHHCSSLLIIAHQSISKT